MSSITGFKSYSNANLQGANTTSQDISDIENDITLIESKLGLIKSVKDYGAMGDGITNDTSAIQSALNTYGRIWFPEGVYMINGPLTVYPNTHIYGDGRNKTICKLLSGGSNLFNCHCENISIRAMSIDGSRDTGGLGHCIRGNISTSGVFDCLFEDLHIYNSDSYGIGLQTGTIKSVIINNCFIENTGSDGIDMKNKDGVSGNEAVIISNVIIKDPSMKAGNTQKTGIDCRGPCILSNICVLIENTPSSASCDGIRFRIGDEADVNGRGGWRSSLTNFYIKAYDSYIAGLGISAGNENLNISNGTIAYFTRGIRTIADYPNCKITNVTAIGCTHGFEDLSIDTMYVNCSAQNCIERGFYFNTCTRSTCIGCTSKNNGQHGFYDNASLTTSLIKCNAQNNGINNYNSFSTAEIISCLNGVVYLDNRISGSITTNGFSNTYNSFSVFTKDLTIANAHVGISNGNINISNGNINVTGTGVINGNGSGITDINPANIANYIDATKIGTGIISNTEFNYLDGVTSSIQSQINNTVKLSGSQTVAGNKTFSSPMTATGIVNNGYLIMDDDLQINDVGTLIVAGTGDIKVNNGWMYGRSDGTSFYDPKTAYSLSTNPIGAIIEWTSASIGLVSGVTTTITGAPTLDKGVWQVSGSITVSRGSGTYTTGNGLYLTYDSAVNGTQYNTSMGMRYHIPAGAGTLNVVYPSNTLVVTASGGYIRPRYNVTVTTVGTMTVSVSFVFTKVA